MFAVFVDPFKGARAQIWIFKMPDSMNLNELTKQPFVICQEQLNLNRERIIRGLWTPLNNEILTGAEDGKLRLINPMNGDLVAVHEAHTKQIQDIQYNKEKTLFITGK